MTAAVEEYGIIDDIIDAANLASDCCVLKPRPCWPGLFWFKVQGSTFKRQGTRRELLVDGKCLVLKYVPERGISVTSV